MRAGGGAEGRGRGPRAGGGAKGRGRGQGLRLSRCIKEPVAGGKQERWIREEGRRAQAQSSKGRESVRAKPKITPTGGKPSGSGQGHWLPVKPPSGSPADTLGKAGLALPRGHTARWPPFSGWGEVQEHGEGGGLRLGDPRVLNLYNLRKQAKRSPHQSHSPPLKDLTDTEVDDIPEKYYENLSIKMFNEPKEDPRSELGEQIEIWDRNQLEFLERKDTIDQIKTSLKSICNRLDSIEDEPSVLEDRTSGFENRRHEFEYTECN